jgi:PAS domain S-box-containing protein
VIGGSIVAGMLIAQSISLLIHNQVLDSPYLSSLPFALIVLAMAFEVGYDLFVAAGTARKLQLSEASLRESEERFRIVADAAPVLIWMSGPDKLCTFFNKAWLEFTGRTLEQEMGHGYREGLHPNDLQRLDTYKAAFEARDPLIMQYRLRRNDGEYRWILDQGVPRYDAQGRFGGYIGSCVDVTELLKKEKALREFEERVVLAAEAAHFGVWEFDTITKRIWVSDKVRELFQFPLDCEISYAEFDQRVHPDDRATRDQALQKAIRAQGAYEIEYRILLPDGNVKWIGGRARCFLGEDGKPTRLLGVSMDITERKQAEELFQLATEASPSGVVLVDHQGRILLVNAHIEELFGFARDELIGKSFDVLVPERFAPSHFNHRANFFAAAETRAIGARRELFGRRKDGSEFRVEIGLNPIQTPRGLLVLANVVDISARLAAEERALRRREQVELLSRVSLLGEMTASLAHELNQPLAAIVNNASAAMQYLEQGKLDRERLQDILTDMAADGQRAHDIMREVRNAIKKGGAIRGRINLNDVVKAVTHLLQPNAAAQLCKVEMSLAPDLPAVEGDPIQIQQVLINLVQNAFDAMHDTSPSRRIVEIVTNYDGGSTICVGVRDHGSGILDTARERLFEHFFTTKEEGLGMGLAIVRSIVEAHGGNIAAEDADGGGALFRFRLPTQESMPQ